MDLLTIQHQDFTQYVECMKFDVIWNKANRNVGEEALLSVYKKDGERQNLSSSSVPRPGVEPGRLAALVFETNASTNSAIWA